LGNAAWGAARELFSEAMLHALVFPVLVITFIALIAWHTLSS
jgi:hypothetical protein